MPFVVLFLHFETNCDTEDAPKAYHDAESKTLHLAEFQFHE